MNGEQQKPPTAENQEEKPCVCSKDHIHESNGCSKCCRENWPYVVSVSVLQEIPSNKRKRDKALRKLVESVRFAFIVVLAFLALNATHIIDTGNIILDVAMKISLGCFVCYGLCMAVFHLLDKILDV